MFDLSIFILKRALAKAAIDDPCPICDYEAAIRLLEAAGGEPIQSARTWLGLWALKGGGRSFYITETGADILERIYDFLSLAALPDPGATKEEK